MKKILIIILFLAVSVNAAQRYTYVTNRVAGTNTSVYWYFPYFYYPMDVKISDDKLYVADTGKNRVHKFGLYLTSIYYTNLISSNSVVIRTNYVTNKSVMESKTIYGRTSSDTFLRPTSLAVDTHSNIYVADSGNSRIMKFYNFTNYMLSWGSPGSGNGQFCGNMNIAVFSSNSTVYVAVNACKRNIQIFSSSGTYETNILSYGTNAGQVQNIGGMVFDSSNYLYVSDYSNIKKYKSHGEFVSSFGSYGTGKSQFSHPTGIFVDSSNYSYVADTWNSRVNKWRNSVWITNWGSFGTGNEQFLLPMGVVVDTSNYAYVLDSGSGRLKKFKKR